MAGAMRTIAHTEYKTVENPKKEFKGSGVARAPQAPRPRGVREAEGARQGPPGRSSRRNPLARSPNKLLAGGPKIVATPLFKGNREKVEPFRF